MTKKERIDKILVDRGLVSSREKAQSLIMAGCVLVDEVLVTKAGHKVEDGASIRIKGEDHPYVGRGGVKLEAAIKEFKIDVEDRICMDIGASTGGFSDCLLQRGAKKIYAIDVGYGQLAWKVASDKRVISIERTNIRAIDPALVSEKIDIVVIDVSFISLELVLPKVIEFTKSGSIIVALVKPQFEVGRELVGKGGIVKDESSHKLACDKVRSVGDGLGLSYLGVIESPILGAKGNKEFLMVFRI